MPTYRIVVETANPLDGETRLPASTIPDQKFTLDPVTGIYTAVLPVGNEFGAFAPGDLGLLGLDGTYECSDISVMSEIGAHAVGSLVGIQTPPTAVGDVEVIAVNTINTPAPGHGVIPDGLNSPIPPGHMLVFNTLADGAASGPQGERRVGRRAERGVAP